ncbi:hypothetical protein B0F90DRAFT_1739504 [Multifurca ochricompacta]|uniref:Uncharacterized protein n=1 Tax=Multifurca ochricompacta TaxID=376703 RepID=A0AAD4M0J2_9AGAM|nr:hypothetical protein B0F90DRAFT_1739504 [Multifurca ochricompacta]
MQKFIVALLAVVTLLATVVPSASAHSVSPLKRETNALRFARGLPPLPPTRRHTANSPTHSHTSVPHSGRVQARGCDTGETLGYLGNTPSGPKGLNCHCADDHNDDVLDLTVIFNSIEKSLACEGPQFGGGIYLGASVTADILGIGSASFVTLANVQIGIEAAEAGIWSLVEETGELLIKWKNVDHSEKPLHCAYNNDKDEIVFVGDIAAFLSVNVGWVEVRLYLVV